MIRGTTPTIYVAFGVEIESLNEFKIIFEQEGKENLVKRQDDCVIDTETNVAYTKLSQKETLAFDERKLVKIQAKALTKDGNVIASDIEKSVFCATLDETEFEGASSEITPIDTNKIALNFTNNNCGFALDFGDMIVYEQIPADKELSSTSTNSVQNKVVTENFARVDNEFLAMNERADTIEEIAKGAVIGKSFLTYQDMVAELNVDAKDKYNTNQHFIIQTIGVPDLYIYGKADYSIPYVYTTDEAIVSATSNGFLQIGYYLISQLETQKVDLSEYAKKSQVPVVNATLKENGTYTLTITMGVE
jgi:hypothetical protein